MGNKVVCTPSSRRTPSSRWSKGQRAHHRGIVVMAATILQPTAVQYQVPGTQYKTNRLLVLSMPREAPALSRVPPDPPRPPRPPHTAALGVPGEQTGAAVQIGERGAWKGALPWTVSLVPGKGGVSIISGDISLPGYFFGVMRGFFLSPGIFFQYRRTAVHKILQQH